MRAWRVYYMAGMTECSPDCENDGHGIVCAEEEGMDMNKKLFAGLVCAVVLLLIAAAMADAPLTAQEIVEQVAVPLALANDTKTGINRIYSAAELAEIVDALRENGITPAEDNDLTVMVTNGVGYYEETTIKEIGCLAFGTPSAFWSLEEGDWYNQQLLKIGAYETYESQLPGPDNMRYEDAEAFALQSVREAYGQDLPVEDRSKWKLARGFSKGDEDEPEDHWSFTLVPCELEFGKYTVNFRDRDPEASVSVEAEKRDWTQPYTNEELLMGFFDVYSWSQGSWPQAVWQKLHEMMQRAEMVQDELYFAECKGYQMTSYPEPNENDITREEAIRIAKAALLKDKAALESAILTEYDGERSWLVALRIWAMNQVVYIPNDHEPDPEAGCWLITIDSRTGEVRSLKEAYGNETYVPEAAYQQAREGAMDFMDAARIAADEIRKIYPDLDLFDWSEYMITGTTGKRFMVEFQTRNIRHGSISATVEPDGTVSEIDAETEPLTGDNLFQRYRLAYGYYAFWEQDRWIQLEKDMAEMKPISVDGKILKATHYPEESSVKVTKDKARELALQTAGWRTAEVHTCVLVDAQPHPVWIMRVIARDGYEDPVIGLDAETGEVVFTEHYDVDETPGYVMYSMPETWKKIENGEE